MLESNRVACVYHKYLKASIKNALFLLQKNMAKERWFFSFVTTSYTFSNHLYDLKRTWRMINPSLQAIIWQKAQTIRYTWISILHVTFLIHIWFGKPTFHTFWAMPQNVFHPFLFSYHILTFLLQLLLISHSANPATLK